ncbi:MAG: Hsp70 family protein [Candidatus Sumerlaeota bacterium]|nr:Hsp70 family protein [Candidatus Sumerlaeota bacterium]
MARIIGIDLGTTNSGVAVMEKNGPVIVPNSLGDRLTPSVVGFSKSGEVLVGKKAKRGAVMNIGRTVFSIKRHMGTSHRVNIEGKVYTPQEISAMILQKLKQDSEDYFGEEITQAVITVPAYFTDAQRAATRDAGEIAGLTVRRIIDEPTAAAVAYGLDKQKDQKILVYDFGGGTFDVSILEYISGVFRVISIHGDTHLGGDDIDNLIVDHLVEQFKKEQNVDLTEDPIAMQRIKEAAEEAKIDLSEVNDTTILVEAVTMSDKGPLTLEASLTRAQLESMIADFVERTMKSTQEAMDDANLKPEDVDTILLVGGSTRIPLVQRRVKDLMGKNPHRDISPDEVVALGAAVQTLILSPLEGELEDTLAARYGKEAPVIIHMTPFNLGVGLQHDQMGVIIERNSTYPVEAKDIFTTTRDFQEAISFPIYEGQEPVASENTFLDLLRIEAITPAPRGVPRIEITFKLNSDRILEVKAEDLATGVQKSITIASTDTRLGEEDKARMRREAQMRAMQELRKRISDYTEAQTDELIARAEKLAKGMAEGAKSKELRQSVLNLKRKREEGELSAAQGEIEVLANLMAELEKGSPA